MILSILSNWLIVHVAFPFGLLQGHTCLWSDLLQSAAVLDDIDQSQLVISRRNRAGSSSKNPYFIKSLHGVGVTCLACLTLCLLVIEHQTLLLRRFHSTGNIASNPLESVSTGETQAPLCQVRCEQSSAPNACNEPRFGVLLVLPPRIYPQQFFAPH